MLDCDGDASVAVVNVTQAKRIQLARYSHHAMESHNSSLCGSERKTSRSQQDKDKPMALQKVLPYASSPKHSSLRFILDLYGNYRAVRDAGVLCARDGVRALLIFAYLNLDIVQTSHAS